jgi:hypothetical protein
LTCSRQHSGGDMHVGNTVTKRCCVLTYLIHSWAPHEGATRL